ncbi:MutS 4 [Candida viswanathii]|uniref:MutS 4 n=1 Tax=Candida viswanathii TaxID=5486 RepID=A0A367Y3L4_9ASCO|nr:MutS 4 [Candida viswanathii]
MTDITQGSTTEGSRYGFVTTAEIPIAKRRRVQLVDDKFEVVMSIFKLKSESMDVGIAVLNTRTIELVLVNFCDTLTFVRSVNLLDVYQPTTVIIPNVQGNPQVEKLKYIIHSNIADRTKEHVEKANLFNASNGLNMLKIYGDLSEAELQLTAQGKELSFAAANACINYCITSRQFRTTNKIRLKFDSCENTMLIDTNTIKDLELLESLAENGTTLFSFFNKCVTKMGQRMLRTSILQPLTHENSIKLRLEAVHELMTNEDILTGIRSLLKQTSDLEKMFTSFLDPKSITGQDQAINNIILLKTALEKSFTVRKSLLFMHSHLLVQIKQILEHDNIQLALDVINQYIRDDCQWANNSLELANQRANAIKLGVNGLLDVSRKIRETLLQEVSDYIANLSEEMEIPMEHRYESSRGFFIKIKEDRINGQGIPETLINKVRKKKIIECTTIDLMKQSSRYNDIVSEITTLNSTIIEDLYCKINEYMPIFLMVSEAIGTLDLLCSFAYFTSIQKGSYVCPEFGQDVTILRSYHPILVSAISDFVANNYSCNHEISRFHVITGANMSGKSVYLRQLAYLVIMSQMGMFVPAEYAKMKIFKSIYSKLSCDNFDVNASLFSKEMSETANILKNLDKDSLVIIDELGRGSSFTDGFSICLAILEHLISIGALVFTSTHFGDLAEILSSKPCVVTSHMETTEVDGKLQMKYNLLQGRTEDAGYGIRYAEHSRLLPKQLIDEAKKVSEVLKSRNATSPSGEQKLQAKRRKLVLELYFALNHITKLDGGATYKAQLLRAVQTKFVDEINGMLNHS